MKKNLLVIGAIILIIAYLVFNIISYAGNDILYVGINTTYSSGVGYSIGIPNNGGKTIWNLRNYNSADKNDENTETKEIYCLKADYGESWEINVDNIVPYNLSYDIQSERDKLEQLLIDSDIDTANDVVTKIIDDNYGFYKELLWVLDNVYISGQSDKTQLLEKIGIYYDEEYDCYNYIPEEKYDFTDKIDYTEYSYILTDEDIKAIQQAVIWYFMNAKLDGDILLDKTESYDWLNITTNGTSFSQLVDVRPDGPDRDNQAKILYNYLIASAKENASKYTSTTNGYTISKPLELNTTGLEVESGIYKIEIVKNGSNYIIGPIKINKNNDLMYNVSLQLINENNQEITSSNYTFTNNKGIALANQDINQLIGLTDGFYIKIPKTLGKDININLTTSYNTTQKTLWLKGVENSATSITLNAEQPAANIVLQPHSETLLLNAKLEETEVTVNKEWNDSSNQDGIRPNSVTVNLKDGDTIVEKAILSSTNNWTYTFKNLVKYENKVEIDYTIEESTVPEGYIAEIIENSANNFTITNTHTPELIEMTVNKEWNDTDNQDGIRPSSVTVNLKKSNATLQTITLNEANNWRYTFTNLPKYENGTEIQYTVEEASIPISYSAQSKGTVDTGYIITNTHTPEVIEVAVNKVWADNDNQDGIRPDSVKIELKNGEIIVDSIILDESNSWAYTFTNLPKYANGVEIEYTVDEQTIPTGYEKQVTKNENNNFTITNTHIPEVTEVIVNKVWNDKNNQDGIRPTSVTVELKNKEVTEQTITLDENKNWTHTFTNLPKYENGVEIQYTVDEPTVPTDYIKSITKNATNNYTIINTHKIFDMALRKHISAVNGTEIGNKRIPNISETTLESGTTATYNHRKDPVVVEENDIVTYTLTIYNEGEKTGYASQIIDQLPTGLILASENGSQIISKGKNNNNKNSYLVRYDTTNNTVILDIVKDTAQSLNSYTTKDGLDYETIEVQCKVVVQANERKEQILTNVAWINEAYDTESNKVATDIDSQPTTTPNVDKDAMEDYTGDSTNKEDLTDNNNYYKGEQDDDDFDKLVVKPKIEITVNKVWEDSNNQDGIRPSSVNVQLKNATTILQTVTLSESNNWAYTFTNLPKYENNVEIEYSVEEETVPAGYEKTIIENSTNNYIITNTYTPEVVEVIVNKTWEDSNNQDGKRPTSVEVNLKVDDKVIQTATLQASDNWKYIFRNLPKYENGLEVEYIVEEKTEVTGYTSSVVENATNNYTIINSYTPEVTEVIVNKVWEDNNNQDGIRPSSVDLQLKNGDTIVETITLDENKNWTHTFTNLPKYENGVQITYIVEEPTDITGYTKSIKENSVNNYTITNKHIAEVIEIKVNKVWADNNNQDGLRTDSVQIDLKIGDTVVNTLTLDSNNNWLDTFTNIPKYANGAEIQYTVAEKEVPEGYTAEVTGSKDAGFTVTNIHETDQTSISVTKQWEDSNNQDGIRPESVSISLLADGTETQQITLSEENSWTYTFTNLPTKKDGVKIEYTVRENDIPEGYEAEILGTSTIGYTAVNTHEPEVLTNVTVNKQWDDGNNIDNIRPTFVSITLLADGVEKETITLDDSNNWTHIFESLPTEENETEIVYTVRENNVPEGYTASVTENSTNDYTITNTHTPNKIFDLALRKYIVKINNNDITTLGLTSRRPSISEVTLQDGTTATYRHKKAPIQVEQNDIITYQITIYNEGEKNGYASQIIDQLPTGLIYNPSSTVTSKDSTGADQNTYTVTYDTTTNKVIFDIINTPENPVKDLNAYTAGKLDYETIEIKCKVIYEPKFNEKNILTNVAWISGEYDTTDNKVAIDRDSQTENSPNVDKDTMVDYKGNVSNKNDFTDKDYHYEGEQDDDDFEKIYVKTFDLALRKFITSINDERLEESREPIVDITPLKNGTGTTAIYNHPKEPVALQIGNKVIYTIRVYNEGEIDGYASEVTDYLPPYLEYVENSTINNQYGWQISSDGRIATTTYLLDKEIGKFDGNELDYEDIQIECKISENAKPEEIITNIAEISEYKYSDTVVTEDIDSKSGNLEENISEDDNDFEKVYVKQFDLALRKFITKVQDREITSRIPQVELKNGQISYEHTKEVITLHVDDVVIYTLRIYNEGEINGYASEITDDIPEYLEYLPEDSTNVEYMWTMYDENGNETENASEAVKIKTAYLSKENSEQNLLRGFNGKTLHYKEVKVAFKVKDPNSNTYIITNHAQISNDTDENGNPIKDKDSITDECNEGEDDQDIENVKVEYFDLSILKFVSKVITIEDGKENVTETGYNGYENPEPVVKVELHRKKLDKVTVKFGYGITITNEGDVAGYATELTDYVPEGLKFEATDNPSWTDEGNNVISTKQLEGKLLKPGESETVEVILTWINEPDNLALKTNIVEISEDNNQYDVPDRDSTPDNEKDNEDDIDIAQVILTVATGRTKTYFVLTLGLLTTVLVGIVLIKRFVI